ncbi:MAG: putative Formate/nitrite transporter [Deltaproteobacteria bacterium]|nr:putative Formate/nitrite transporter [Deltaproteobacteria bacterium]
MGESAHKLMGVDAQLADHLLREFHRRGGSCSSRLLALPFAEAFFKGILCNILVCLAVWLAVAGRSVIDKIFAIVFPISAFVAAGFEHSVANMYFIPLGILLRESSHVANAEVLTWAGLIANLVPVTLGNIFGGGVMVALVYYFIYRHHAQ